jgi:hypothetical protein
VDIPQKKARAVSLFDVPLSIANVCGVKEVGLVQLTSDEELLCFKRAKGDNARIALELAKSSLVEADGKVLASHDGTIDTFWKDCDPKLRQLVITAYVELHAAPEEDQDAFLKSRRTRVA